MAGTNLGAFDRPVFAHQVKAFLAKQDREDLEAIGGSLVRAGFRRQGDDAKGASKRHKGRGGWARSDRSAPVNFFRASPLCGRDRQTGGVRIQHFDMKPVGVSHVPTAADGTPHQRYKPSARSPGDHYDYLTNGARLTASNHLGYIERFCSPGEREQGLIMDLLDEEALRAEQNRDAVKTNIPGGHERRRSLFEAAARCERRPRKHHLTASTADIEKFNYPARLAIGRGWARMIADRLAAEKARGEAKAAAAGKLFKDRQVEVLDVTPERAHAILSALDRIPLGSAGLLNWRQGRTGRSHYRFVLELLDGLNHDSRREIRDRFCDTLIADGWMVVGVIHQPDLHGDRRNYHIHVDAYDRPSGWLEEHGCWDFEHKVRVRGRDTFPFRQNKVRYQPAQGSRGKVNVSALFRERYISIVNDVVGDRPGVVRFVAGTYAENAIALTPLDHMGNAAIAAEKRGIATGVGTRNAHRITSMQIVLSSKSAEAEAVASASRRAKPRVSEAAANAAVSGTTPSGTGSGSREEKVVRRQRNKSSVSVVAIKRVIAAVSKAGMSVATLEVRPDRAIVVGTVVASDDQVDVFAHWADRL